ncbi:uncharacterized protein LOC117588078 [Drosophila guanche]|uniref:uncharacterized protein LOC117588078 n=1 Tax=Drosophila guanche TaxID=7266 RepID=UPI0014714072|nr:uncharacterized protein LOC117588078 [Drosophila guanche]
MVILNPIEIVCVYVVQPIIDFLGYLLEVHYVAYLSGLAVIGIIIGLLFSIVSVIWYKSTHGDEPNQLPKEETPNLEGVYIQEGPFNKKDD